MGTTRSSVKLLADPMLGPYLAGNFAAAIGIWFQNITAVIVVFNQTGSPFLVGVVGVLNFAGPLFASPWTGVLSDRVDRRKLLIFAKSLSTSVTFALALWIGLVGLGGRIGVWPILVGSTLLGIGAALSSPAQLAIIPSLASKRDLDQAVALNNLTFNGARVIGPAVGATVVVNLGASAAYATASLCFASLVLVLVVLVKPRPPRTSHTSEPTSSAIRAGVSFLRTHRRVALILVAVACVGLAVDPVLTLVPPMAQLLGGDDRLVGQLASAFGLGSVASIVFLGSLRQRIGVERSALAGLLLIFVGMAIFGLSPSPTIAIAALILAGVGFLAATSSLTADLQHRVPDEFRGRMMAYWTMAFLGSRPIAALLGGSLGELINPRVAVLVLSSAALVGAVVLGWSTQKMYQTEAWDDNDSRTYSMRPANKSASEP